MLLCHRVLLRLLCVLMVLSHYRDSDAQSNSSSQAGNFPDRIIVQPRLSTGKKGIRCRVIDYTGALVTIREMDSNIDRTYPTKEVTRVETPQSREYREGRQLLASNQILPAEEKLKLALQQETREWVRREILSELVRTALLRGDYVTAATRLELIYLSDSTTHHLELLPAIWSAQVLTPEQIRNGAELISGETELSHLVGASILLFQPGFEETSKQILIKIIADNDRRLRRIAEAQLWRLELKSEEFSVFTIDQWTRHIERMPTPMRGGPYYLLAEAYRFKQLRDEAALTYLRVPVLYEHDRLLAASACYKAAEVLQLGGRSSEAVALYRELIARYRGTDAARKADAILKSMANRP